MSWGSSAGWYTWDERDLDQVLDGALAEQGRRSVHVVAYGWPLRKQEWRIERTIHVADLDQGRALGTLAVKKWFRLTM